MGLHRTLLAVIVGALSVALYQLQGIIATLQDWSYLWQPPSVAQLVGIGALFCAAIAAALKLDLGEIKGNG